MPTAPGDSQPQSTRRREMSFATASSVLVLTLAVLETVCESLLLPAQLAKATSLVHAHLNEAGRCTGPHTSMRQGAAEEPAAQLDSAVLLRPAATCPLLSWAVLAAQSQVTVQGAAELAAQLCMACQAM